MRAIAAISIGVLLLACGGNEGEEPGATESRPAPARPEAPPARPRPAANFMDAVEWGGEGPAPDLRADTRDCEEQVARDPRSAKAEPGARFLAQLACLGNKGWKARESEPAR